MQKMNEFPKICSQSNNLKSQLSHCAACMHVCLQARKLIPHHLTVQLQTGFCFKYQVIWQQRCPLPIINEVIQFFNIQYLRFLFFQASLLSLVSIYSVIFWALAIIVLNISLRVFTWPSIYWISSSDPPPPSSSSESSELSDCCFFCCTALDDSLADVACYYFFFLPNSLILSISFLILELISFSFKVRMLSSFTLSLADASQIVIGIIFAGDPLSAACISISLVLNSSCIRC